MQHLCRPQPRPANCVGARMEWQLTKRPLVAAAYAVNLAVRARRGLFGRKRHTGSARGDHPRLHRRLLGRHALSRQPGLLPPVLDAGPELQRAVAGAHLAAAPGAGHRLVRVGDRTWERRGSHVTTTIHFFDQPVDVFDYGVDCLPLMMAALHRIGADEVLREHRSWLEAEVRHYMDEVVDPGDRAGAQRPQVQRAPRHDRQPMQRVRQQHGRPAGHDPGGPGLGVPEPMAPLALAPQRILLEHFWDARGFFRDSPGDTTPSGEGNIWPFWTG